MGKRNSIKAFGAHNGFTLIELLVVVLIIGILAAVALPQYNKAILKSRMVQIENDLSALAQAQQRYYLENDEYATELSQLDIEVPECKPIPGTSMDKCRYRLSDDGALFGKIRYDDYFDTYFMYFTQDGHSNCAAPMPTYTLICLYGESFCSKIGLTKKIPGSCHEYIRP